MNKKIIQEYWTKNVPGLGLLVEKYSIDQKELYVEVDRYRYQYDSYIVPLIDSFAEKGKLILEVGCGMGTDSRYISKKGARIVSLDLSFDNVALTMKGMRLFNLDGNGVCSDGENLPFKDSCFDVVYSFGVLHHTPDTQRAIDEIYRVLKPGGKCVIMLYHKGYAYYILLFLYGYKKLLGLYTQEELMSRYDHTPLSKQYSTEEAVQLFKRFKNPNITMTTFGGVQVHPFLKYVYMLFTISPFLMRRLGSFMIIKGEK